jgi:hypothetical protein
VNDVEVTHGQKKETVTENGPQRRPPENLGFRTCLLVEVPFRVSIRRSAESVDVS